MICKNCGKELFEGTKNCPSCGAKVEEEKVVYVPLKDAPKDESYKVGLGFALDNYYKKLKKQLTL